MWLDADCESEANQKIGPKGEAETSTQVRDRHGSLPLEHWNFKWYSIQFGGTNNHTYYGRPWCSSNDNKVGMVVVDLYRI